MVNFATAEKIGKIKRQSFNKRFAPHWGKPKGKHMFQEETPAGDIEKPADESVKE